ncbi:MAG: hypothetical protein ABI573_05970 [Chloroflexota bacterium]
MITIEQLGGLLLFVAPTAFLAWFGIELLRVPRVELFGSVA